MIRLVLTDIAKKEGRKVVNPETNRRIDDKGILVKQLDSYWKARIDDNDVEIQKPTKQKKD